MKKIIDGKKYDTETAEFIERTGNEYAMSDFKYFSEALYLKKTGEFFLHGEGHAMTKYGKDFTDSTRGFGEQIIPLTIDEAMSWAKKHCETDTYEKLFGEVAE